MAEHLAEEISVEGMAAVAGLSPFHFSRVFKHATGMSPLQYLRRVRIETAKRLLEGKNQTIDQVEEFTDELKDESLDESAKGPTPGSTFAY